MGKLKQSCYLKQVVKVIAIVNQKGGVGKTTTAINLAASLGVAEKRVLLIDLDPQSNTSSGVGLSIRPPEKQNLYTLLAGQTTAAEAILSTATPFVDVIPAASDLAAFEIEAVDLEDREYYLQKALAPILDRYEYILIDCPPSLSLLTLNALCAAEYVLVPLQAEYYAMEGLSRLLETIELVQENLNERLKLAGIVLTMFDKRNRLSHQVEAEIQEHFPQELWQTKIPRNVRLSEAPSFGKPVMHYDLTSVGAQSYLKLARECIAYFESEKGQAMSAVSPADQAKVSSKSL